MVTSPLLTGDGPRSLVLQRRAREVCVVYQDHPMPSGVTPPYARIGVEVDPGTERTLLFVERGLRYIGSDPQVRSWVEAGVLTFDRFADASSWLAGAVGAAVTEPDPRQSDAPESDEITSGRICCALDRSPTALAAAVEEKIRGQHRAIGRLAQRVVLHLGRRRPRRPATFFLIGPTGVGKTRTAERLAEVLTEQGRGDQQYDWLRLDMNEYRERHRVSRLLGAPPGYVGYGDGAHLADALTRNPRHVVLFDEIDKAHPDILVVLMNLIDRGRLSSAGAGRDNVDARYAILLFTSNQAAEALARRAEENELSDAQLEQLCRRELRRSGVAPELLGRVRTMLLFDQLDDQALAEIAVGAVREAGTEFGLDVTEVEPAAVRRILAGYQTMSLGARPIEHAIDECFGNAFLAAADTGDTRPVVCGHDGSNFTVHPVSDGPPSPLHGTS